MAPSVSGSTCVCHLQISLHHLRMDRYRIDIGMRRCTHTHCTRTFAEQVDRIYTPNFAPAPPGEYVTNLTSFHAQFHNNVHAGE